jgi:hypothetical protein
LIANVEGRTADVRTALDSAIANTPNIGAQFAYRRAQAISFLSEGNVQQTMASLAQQLKDAEAINARGQVTTGHQTMALVAAGTRDSAGAERHLAAVTPAEGGAGAAAAVDAQVIVYSLIGNAPAARAALGDYTRMNGPQPNLPSFTNTARTQNVHRMTGLVLLAEKKPTEAIAELRQGGNNPYSTLGIIEAYKQLKDNKKGDAERAAFFQRKDFSVASTATAIIRYRAKK